MNLQSKDMQFTDIRQKVKTVLAGYPFIEFCALFGSVVSGRLTEKSDIDVAVAGMKPLSLIEKNEISLELCRALKREIDLIDLQSVSGLIFEESLCSSRIIINNNKALFAELLKRLWYYQADMKPYIRRILEQRAARWLQ